MITIEQYKENKEIVKQIFDKLDISYFLSNKKSEDSLISYIQEDNSDVIKENIEKIIDFISNLKDNDILKLSDCYGNLSSDDNWLEEIIRIVHYTIDYPDLFDIYEWKDDCGEYKPTKLKDPFYSFNELENLKKLKNSTYLFLFYHYVI